MRCLTLFVTHYPSLAELAVRLPGQVACYHMAFLEVSVLAGQISMMHPAGCLGTTLILSFFSPDFRADEERRCWRTVRGKNGFEQQHSLLLVSVDTRISTPFLWLERGASGRVCVCVWTPISDNRNPLLSNLFLCAADCRRQCWKRRQSNLTCLNSGSPGGGMFVCKVLALVTC